MESDAYLLGTHEIELKRLQLQDRLWKAQTHSLWERASIGLGMSVLELGCGPGFSTMDLAQRVGPEGKVLGWDRSDLFLKHLGHASAEVSIDWIRTHQGDVTSALEESLHDQFDALYSRWLLCWMERPQDALQLAWKALRPGGRIALFDYFHYDALDLLPQDPAFRHGIEAVKDAWRAAGGDPSLGTRLPSLLESAGFRIDSSTLVTRSASPQDALWQWPMSFFPDFMQQLAADGFLTAEEAEAFLEAFRRNSKDATSVFLAPPMLSIVAVKP